MMKLATRGKFKLAKLLIFTIILSACTMMLTFADINVSTNANKGSDLELLVSTLETKYGTRAEVVNETTVFIPLNHNANIAYLSESKGITKLQASNLISKNKTSGIVTRGQDTIIREGIMLKSFALVSGTNENCTVVATINVALEE